MLTDGATVGTKDTAIRGAVIAGIYALKSPLDFTCSTGNCTWPRFSSLAICSQCRNTTLQTEKKCAEEGVASGGTKSCRTRCNYTLPGGTSISAYSEIDFFDRGCNPASFVNVSTADHGVTAINSTAESLWHFGPNLTIPTVGLAKVSTLRFTRPPPMPQGDIVQSSFDTTQCSLVWCAKTHTAVTSLNSTLSPGSTTTAPLVNVPNGGFSETFTTALDPAEVLASETFTIETSPWSDVAAYIAAVFTGAVLFDHQVYSDQRDPLQAVWQHGNVSAVFENIAAAMSNQIRLGPNATQVAGVAWRSEAYYSARWEWLALPATFSLMGLLFMVLAIHQSTRYQAQAWKSSSLALLFATLHGWDTATTRVKTPHDLTRAAQKMRGGLTDKSEPLLFEKSGQDER